ncbi:chromosomal replication initiator protein DnaA [Treponema sp. OMZ 840]|uniref:chromosomal replication initiator protein DnaA n=1 Tax=Treponema sp. OMZ 840 TaxID=244313 RepID=UPI003D9117FA
MAAWDYSDFWKEAVIQIREELSINKRSQEFDMWFSPVEYVNSKESVIIVSCPSKFLQDNFISRGYASLVQKKLHELSAKSLSLEFIIKAPVFSSEKEKKPKEVSAQRQKNQNESNDGQKIKKHPDLREDYTFDTFVMGENNSFAYNAAVVISKNPGRAYNPVLIYGGVGLGKTHLIQAIGNAMHNAGASKVIYITAENFTNEFIQSLNDKTTQKFKNKYRSADVLLIDDIHFLQNKEGTQEELFYTFDTLYNSYRQIVFTCDRPISELKNLTERLRSRFERGLNVDLQPPKYETRRAILEKKLEHIRTVMSEKVISLIPNEVIDLIAKNVETNVRDLESCLTKIIAYAELVQSEITLEIAQQQLRDKFSAAQPGNIGIDIIQRVVADDFNISLSDIKGKKRTKNVTLPRQIAMYIAQEITEFSTTELGIEFGGRDHTTVMYSCQKIRDAILTDSKLDSKIQYLIKNVKDYKK